MGYIFEKEVLHHHFANVFWLWCLYLHLSFKSDPTMLVWLIIDNLLVNKGDFNAKRTRSRFQPIQSRSKDFWVSVLSRLNSFASVQVWFKSDVSFLSYDTASLCLRSSYKWRSLSTNTVSRQELGALIFPTSRQLSKHACFIEIWHFPLEFCCFTPRPNEGRFQPKKFCSKNSGSVLHASQRFLNVQVLFCNNPFGKSTCFNPIFFCEKQRSLSQWLMVVLNLLIKDFSARH
jgi:hypothetical protein